MFFSAPASPHGRRAKDMLGPRANHEDSMRSATRALFVATALCAGLACSTLKVSDDYDPAVDFAKYRSYAWLPDQPGPTGRPRLDSPLVQERIRKAIDAALAGKGYSESAQSPDFLVRYDLTAERRVDVSSYDTPYYTRYGYRMVLPETVVREYDVGSLIVDVADAREKKVVWRGIAEARLRGESAPTDPAQVQERVTEVVNAVLEKFPPKGK